MDSTEVREPSEWDDLRRSRVTRGKEVLPNIDGRSAIARRYRDVAGLIVADQGGAEHIAEVRTQLVRRFAACAVMAEQIEALLVNGGHVDIAEHALLSSTMVRIAQRIGLGRRMRNVTPSLAEYLDAGEDATNVSLFELQRRRAAQAHAEFTEIDGKSAVGGDEANE